MAGTYAALFAFVAITTFVAWRSTRRALAALPTGADQRPETRALFPFAAALSLLAVGLGIVITWAPSLNASECSQALVEAGRCRPSALSGAGGLLAFLVPIGVAVAYLWGEGILTPPPEPVTATAEPEKEPEPGTEPIEEEAEPDDRLLEALVKGERSDLDAALDAATECLAKGQLALVFSGAVEPEANEALADLAEATAAPCFIMETDGPHADAARNAAGFGVPHVDELALALAGGFFQGVLLVDAKAEFHALTLMGLQNLGSVCLAERPTKTAEVCSVVLPAASSEELADIRDDRELDGDRRPRAEWIARLRKRIAPDWDPPSGPVAGEDGGATSA